LRPCGKLGKPHSGDSAADPHENNQNKESDHDEGLGCLDRRRQRLVLIDYQKETFEVIRYVRLLAKTAKAFGMPIVLSTVGVEYGFNGPTLASILSELDGIEPIDRSSMNAFEDSAFGEAVKTTGKKRLIIGGLHTEICLTFASVQALKDDYEVMYVADAVGGRSPTAHRTAIERLAHAGAARPPRSPSSRSSSATGQPRSLGRPATSSTGTSTRSRGTPTRLALRRRRSSQLLWRGPTEMSGRVGKQGSASPQARAEAWDVRPP
jgi:nicotinamidase-related amidase